jgi:two-component system, NarL family, sensor histidine kinase UhpB
MHLAPPPGQSPAQHVSPWRDTAIVFLLTALSVALAARFNWSEALYSLTRPEERLQLDELPIGMLVLLMGLVWLAWRRNRQARSEIKVRGAIQIALERALAANRALAQETLRIQEADRKHLARELHDELGQYLNTIKLDAVSIQDAGADDRRSALVSSSAIIRTVDHLQAIVSRMIAQLRPVALDELGLVAAIEHSIGEWRRRLPDTLFEFHSHGGLDNLEEPLSLTVYRLVQESLTNVYKHAQAGRVEIDLERRAPTAAQRDEVRVRASDDGRGIDLAAQPLGYGLGGMRERVELVGGDFAVESAPGLGLRVIASLPTGSEEKR